MFILSTKFYFLFSLNLLEGFKWHSLWLWRPHRSRKFDIDFKIVKARGIDTVIKHWLQFLGIFSSFIV